MNAVEPDYTVMDESPSNLPRSNSSLTSDKLEGKLDEVLGKLLDHQKVLESVQDQLEKLKTEKTSIEEPISKITEKQEPFEPLVSKQFVLKAVFEDVSSWKEEQQCESESEEHFGVSWNIEIVRENKKIGFYLFCSGPESKWVMEVEYEAKAIGPNNKIIAKIDASNFSEEYGVGWNDFLKWDDMETNYLIDNHLKVEFHVKIKKTYGIYKENLRRFDESTKHLSDMTLIVDDQKFFVSKLFLAAQSSYFEKMFLGIFAETKETEITLNGVDPKDFQKYLEVLHGESVIHERNVEAILLVADMYITPTVVQKCEEFIIEKSTKTLRKKLELAVGYRLEILKEKCLSKINTLDDLRSVTPVDVEDLDPSFMALLLRKALSF